MFLARIKLNRTKHLKPQKITKLVMKNFSCVKNEARDITN